MSVPVQLNIPAPQRPCSATKDGGVNINDFGGLHKDVTSIQGMTEATVDLAAVAHNTALLAKAAGSAHLMAVVKADGFGHGATQIARTALAHGASWLGVTSQTEAMLLRHEGINAPILMWLYGPSENLDPVVAANVDVSVASTAHLGCVAEAAKRGGHIAAVHLKIDTGLARSGVLPGKWVELVAAAGQLEQAGLIRVAGIWSHLSNAEDLSDLHYIEQSRLFAEALEASRFAKFASPLRHIANSAGLLQQPDLRFDLARAGIALYGIEPVAKRRFGLRPAMTLRAQIILTKRVAAGTRVSYGRSYVTERETILALIPLGFADGVLRAAWRHGSVSINGVRCPIAGQICMDQFLVDATDARVEIGDTAVLFGTGEDGEPTAADWAGWAGTNTHEILTRVGSRVTRRYRPALR
jgi:alanine racemase